MQREQQPENTTASERIDPAELPAENTHSEAELTTDGASENEAQAEPTANKPAMEGEMPDTTKNAVIEHGAPDKARNDSVKAAKTKGKF